MNTLRFAENKSDAFKYLINNSELNIRFQLDPDLPQIALYKGNLGTIFISSSAINIYQLMEEVVHANQKQKYQDAMINTISNYEFEAKLILDVTLMNNVGGMGISDEAVKKEYVNFYLDIQELTREQIISEFHKLCFFFSYPGNPPPVYNPTVNPNLLLKLLNK